LKSTALGDFEREGWDMPMSQLLFSFTGRLNRKPYWLTTLAMVAVFLVIIVLVLALAGGLGALSGGASGLGAAAILLVIIYIPLLWIGLALGAKRLHDRNKSGWWLLLFWVLPGVLQGIGEQVGTLGIVLMIAAVAISIWGLVEIGFLRGTVGPNQYGPDPLEGHA
jgi:uncharacterized membrane protein YhaH (DUF805 family)